MLRFKFGLTLSEFLKNERTLELIREASLAVIEEFLLPRQKKYIVEASIAAFSDPRVSAYPFSAENFFSFLDLNFSDRQVCLLRPLDSEIEKAFSVLEKVSKTPTLTKKRLWLFAERDRVLISEKSREPLTKSDWSELNGLSFNTRRLEKLLNSVVRKLFLFRHSGRIERVDVLLPHWAENCSLSFLLKRAYRAFSREEFVRLCSRFNSQPELRVFFRSDEIVATFPLTESKLEQTLAELKKKESDLTKYALKTALSKRDDTDGIIYVDADRAEIGALFGKKRRKLLARKAGRFIFS